MDETTEAVNWTCAYLDWIDVETQPLRGRGDDGTVMKADTEWADAYLEWIDSVAAPAPPAGGGSLDGSMRRLDVFREAILLTALHTETECMQILRERLANGSAGIRAVKLAAEALQHAERLLEEERGAWRALNELRTYDRRRSSAAGAGVSDGSWSNALEGVAADVHALASKVVALQVRPRRAARL